MSKKIKKHSYALVIMDGFGYAAPDQLNAISHANMPHIKNLLQHYPHTILNAAGTAVGLPENYIGNSEVGHITIGSGRIIKQDLVRINELISHNTLQSHPIINSCFSQLTQSKKTLHIMGLLSDAGVHSHISHLFAYIDVALSYNIASIKIHPFLDGRDVVQPADYYLRKLQEKISQISRSSCTIASITGRFYAMDRDKNWERIKQTYDMLTQQHTLKWTNWSDALDYYYKKSMNDEFIPPTPFYAEQLIQNGDGILFFNYRPDRARQLTASFVDPDFDSFSKKNLHLTFFITPIKYSSHLKTEFLLKKIPTPNTLKEVLSHAHKTIFSIAETEKYAHITYFFNGGKEKKLLYETRILVPSTPLENYAHLPEMSAAQITQKVIESLHTKPCDFYLINYANADMVGHSGNFKATVQAIEFLDTQIGTLYNAFVEQNNGTLIITADHGNAEDMSNKAHTKNPVLFLVINKDLKNKSISLPLHQLSDIAPFILNMMRVDIPHQM